jgi:hypothetical protein
MTTIDEARATLEEGRHLYASGHWDDLYSKLHPVHEAGVLEGTEKGESAFYLGEACLYKGNPDHVAGMMYLDEAIPLATVDFSQWAKEELTKAQQPADHAQAADQAHPAGPDVSGHPDLMAGIHLPDWVAHAQAKLVHLNCYTGRVDGMFGPSVDAAVKYLQGHYQLTADGVIGQTTWTVLETYAPGVTGHPDGSADQAQAADPHADQAHAADPHAAQAHAADPHAAQAHAGQAHAADPNAGTMTMPADSIQGGHPAAEQHWNPETPNVDDPNEKHEQQGMSEAGEVEINLKPKIGKSYGPVTVKELVIKGSVKVSTEKGKFVAVTNSAGGNVLKPGESKVAVKIDTASWDIAKVHGWKIALKGNVEISSGSGIGVTVEITNPDSHIFGEVKVTFVKLDSNKGEYKFAEVTPSVGGKWADYPIQLEGHGTVYATGKISVGVTLTPNEEWFIEQGLKAAADASAEAVPTGLAAVGAGEAIITTGFIGAAVAVLYVGYRNIQDIEALKQLRTDADKAVDDFGKGFVAAWTKGSAPGGYWGTAGASAGQKQFDADVHGFEELMRQRHPGKTMDNATMDAVKKQWHDTAAEKSGAFESVAEAMFGKMVRTAIYMAWLKANGESSSLPGDIRETAKNYAGITGGGSDQPDVMAAQAAAKNANIQIRIDSWQHAVEP